MQISIQLFVEVGLWNKNGFVHDFIHVPWWVNIEKQHPLSSWYDKPFIAEHLLSITVGTNHANNCPSIRDPIQAFFISSYPQVFLLYPYSGALGILAKTLNVVATFTWSYTGLNEKWKLKKLFTTFRFQICSSWFSASVWHQNLNKSIMNYEQLKVYMSHRVSGLNIDSTTAK